MSCLFVAFIVPKIDSHFWLRNTDVRRCLRQLAYIHFASTWGKPRITIDKVSFWSDTKSFGLSQLRQTFEIYKFTAPTLLFVLKPHPQLSMYGTGWTNINNRNVILLRVFEQNAKDAMPSNAIKSMNNRQTFHTQSVSCWTTGLWSKLDQKCGLHSDSVTIWCCLNCRINKKSLKTRNTTDNIFRVALRSLAYLVA